MNPSPRAVDPRLLDRNGHAGAPDAYYPSPVSRGTSPLRELLVTLWKGRIPVLLACLICGGLATAWVFTTPPEYEASSLLSVELYEDPMKQGLGLGVEADLGMNYRILEQELWILRQSVDIADYVANALLELGTVPGTDQPITPLYDDEGNRLTREQVASRVSRHVKFDVAAREVDGIKITGVSETPAEAALIANLFSEAYIARTQESSRARIFASRTFLEEQERKFQSDLTSMEAQISRFMSQEGAAALDEEASQTVEQIAQLESIRDETRIELGMQRAAFATLEDDLREIEPKLAQRVASGLETELSRVQAAIANLEFQAEQIRQQNPNLDSNTTENARLARAELQQIEERAADARARAEQLSREYVDEVLSVGGVDPSGGGTGGFSYVAEKRRRLAELRIQITGLEAKLEAVTQRLESYEAKLREIPGQTIQLAQLRRAQQSAERLYVFIGDKLQEFKIAEQAEIGYAEVIRPASVPLKPVRPKKARMVFLSLVFGIILGAGFVYARKHFDTRVHQPQDIRDMGYPVVGVIPDMSAFVKEKFNGEEHVFFEGQKIASVVPMVLEPLSHPAEAYRRLRTNIQFSRPDVDMRTLIVTSAEAGEGKSTTSLNLAMAMAQSGKRTVILDADLRRPSLHRLLNVPRRPGLSELLFIRDSAGFSSYRTPYENLYFIPAGATVPNPTEVLGSQSMGTLASELQEEFDIVIIDTPPVLTFSEGMLLSTHGAPVLIVSAAGRTDARAFRDAVETLEGVGAVVIGAVLNRFDPGGTGVYGYGYHSGYYYQRYQTYGQE